MKYIWLTGASSGIGAQLAEQLLAQGHVLALSARNVEALDEIAQRWPKRVLVLAGDLSEPQQVQTIIRAINCEWGKLDQVILNAGTCEYIDAAHFEAAMVERVMRANLLSAAYCVEAALPLLRRSKCAHLVAMSSSVTFLALPRAAAYGASKAALRYLFESLRIDLAHEEISVTLISPGFVDTPLTQRNDFPMPMRWSANKAAQYIANRLDKKPLEIRFPRPFICTLRLLGCLPARWQLALGKRLARPSQGSL